MEELTRGWGNFTLSKKENAGIVLPKAPKGKELFLAAKFYTPRALNIRAMGRTFKLLWRCSDGFRIQNLNDHKVLFVFEDVREVNRIVVGQPWSFDKHLVCVQKYEKGSPMRSLSFKTTIFWVQVHDIPFHYMSTEVAETICENVGEVVRSIGAETEEGGSFFRVRIRVDITLPLCRGRLVTFEEGKRSWV